MITIEHIDCEISDCGVAFSFPENATEIKVRSTGTKFSRIGKIVEVREPKKVDVPPDIIEKIRSQLGNEAATENSVKNAIERSGAMSWITQNSIDIASFCLAFLQYLKS